MRLSVTLQSQEAQRSRHDTDGIQTRIEVLPSLKDQKGSLMSKHSRQSSVNRMKTDREREHTFV